MGRRHLSLLLAGLAIVFPRASAIAQNGSVPQLKQVAYIKASNTEMGDDA